MSYALGARRRIIEWRARWDAAVPGTPIAPVTHRWVIHSGRRNVIFWQASGTTTASGFQAAWAASSNSIIGANL